VKAGRCVRVGTPCFGPFCVKFSALGERQQQSENWVMSWVFQQWMPQFVPDSEVINYITLFVAFFVQHLRPLDRDIVPE